MRIQNASFAKIHFPSIGPYSSSIKFLKTPLYRARNSRYYLHKTICQFVLEKLSMKMETAQEEENGTMKT